MVKETLYSGELGIRLGSGREAAVFRWFLAALLMGKPIQESVAKKTYRLFAERGVTTLEAIRAKRWAGLVKILDDGHYVRYDFSTASTLLRIMRQLQDRYGGRITNVHKAARDPRDLERRLSGLYGVGPVTVNIFLREMRTVWKKADPEPLPVVRRMARKLRMRLPKNRKTVAFMRKEAMLLRRRKMLR